MKNHIMKNHIRLLWMSFTFAISAVISCLALTGCDAQNPVCTDNFCFVGEAFPRSELEAGQEFSEVDIDDSAIFAALVGIPEPVETPVNGTQTFADILTSVQAMGADSPYHGKTVTITAIVAWKSNAGTTLSLSEDGDFREGTKFFVTSYADTSKLDRFVVGNTYTVRVHIHAVGKATTGDAHMIWSHIDD